MKKLSVILLAILTLIPVFAFGKEKAEKEDRLEVQGGPVLTGIIEKSDEEILWLKTDYAGTLQVEVARINRISSYRKIAGTLPRGIPFVDLNAVVAKKAPATGNATPAKNAASKKMNEGWSLDVGANLSGKKGNTDKLDMTFTVEAQLNQDDYRLDLYSRYGYGTNKGELSSDELVWGGKYTNFLSKNFGVFIREELEHDELEELTIRSTSAAGLSWKVNSSQKLNMETRAGISYRYDDYKSGGYESFPGIDLGLDVQWKFAKWGEFKGSYTMLPTFEDSDAYILEQDSGINLKLDYLNNWSVRFGVWTKYNNQPTGNNENTDVRYYVRVTSSWK